MKEVYEKFLQYVRLYRKIVLAASHPQRTLDLEYEYGDDDVKIWLAEYIASVIQFYTDQCGTYVY